MKLISNDVIRTRALILSGTPPGVIYQDIPLETKISGIFSWIAGGWNLSITQNAIEAYIREARESKIHLQPKNTVAIHVDRMGILRNRVENSK